MRIEINNKTPVKLVVKLFHHLTQLGQRAKSGTNLKNLCKGTGEINSPVKTTAELRQRRNVGGDGSNQYRQKSKSEIISPLLKTTAELGQRAKLGQGRPVKNGEIISPFKTTAGIAKEVKI